jgi:hypothetical protein
MTLLLMINAKYLFVYKRTKGKRKFIYFAFHLFKISVYDWITLVFWAILYVTRWRLGMTKKAVAYGIQVIHSFIID